MGAIYHQNPLCEQWHSIPSWLPPSSTAIKRGRSSEFLLALPTYECFSIEAVRIVILQGAFLPIPPILGGAVEKMWFRLGQEFASVGHEVVQISRRHPKLRDVETIHGVQHIRIVGSDTLRSLLGLKWRDLCYTLRAIPQLPRADVIVTNTFWAPLILPCLSRTPIYVDVARMPKGQMRFYAKVSRLRANSMAVAQAIVQEWPAAASKVRIIPNPLPFTPPQSVNIEEKQPIILYAGRLHEEKGLVLLLKAWSRLPSELIGTWKLQIVGPWQVVLGGSGEAFFAELSSLADPRNVEFMGFISDISTLNKLYQKAAVFVYPSLAESGETFGLAVLEAMAWGCAPIVSSLPCFSDFIQHENNGLLFNHRSPNAVDLLTHWLVTLMNQNDKRERLATQALQVRVSHSPNSIAQQFLQDFQGLVSVGRRYDPKIKENVDK